MTKPDTLTDAFWDRMTPEQQADAIELDSLGLLILPTGDRLIFPDKPTSVCEVYAYDAGWSAYNAFAKRPTTWVGRQSGQSDLRLLQRAITCHLISSPGKLEAFRIATEFFETIGGPKDAADRSAILNEIESNLAWQKVDEARKASGQRVHVGAPFISAYVRNFHKRLTPAQDRQAVAETSIEGEIRKAVRLPKPMIVPSTATGFSAPLEIA